MLFITFARQRYGKAIYHDISKLQKLDSVIIGGIKTHGNVLCGPRIQHAPCRVAVPTSVQIC